MTFLLKIFVFDKFKVNVSFEVTEAFKRKLTKIAIDTAAATATANAVVIAIAKAMTG